MADVWKPFPDIIFCESDTSDCRDCFIPCVHNSLLITVLDPNLLCHLQLHTS